MRNQLALLLCTALLTGCAADRGTAGSAPAGTELPQARPKIDFTLTDTGGRDYDFRERTHGRLTLVFFGYTHCPDICSVTMANLGAALDRLPPDTRERTRVIFVTTDPERDTPERIRTWLDRFHREMIGLRGDIDRVNRVMASLGLPPAMRDPGGTAESYTVGHAGHVVVFTPDDSLRYYYPPTTRRLEWIRDLNRLAARGRADAS